MVTPLVLPLWAAPCWTRFAATHTRDHPDELKTLLRPSTMVCTMQCLVATFSFRRLSSMPIVCFHPLSFLQINYQVPAAIIATIRRTSSLYLPRVQLMWSLIAPQVPSFDPPVDLSGTCTTITIDPSRIHLSSRISAHSLGHSRITSGSDTLLLPIPLVRPLSSRGPRTRQHVAPGTDHPSGAQSLITSAVSFSLADKTSAIMTA
ncbi:hypothetical protein K439DRAFT_271756 [Ramaria rubella]|nr:hypothetical protein K439DRAFT_271756 [Ramaria rubella]